MMKTFLIRDTVRNEVVATKEAATEKSALRKYRDENIMSTGVFALVNDNGKLKLISSYGTEFEANEKED